MVRYSAAIASSAVNPLPESREREDEEDFGNLVADATPEVLKRLDRLDKEELAVVGPRRGLFTGTIDAVRGVIDYRDLLWVLIKRDIKTRYKDSSLGFIWSLLRPLTNLLVYFLVIGKFLGAARNIPDFAIFMLAGLMVWNLFSEILGGGTGSIVGSAGLVKKVYVPREVFPLACVGSALFNFFMQLVLVVIALFLTGHLPTGIRLVYFPVAIAIAVVWGLAGGMLGAALNVYLRDMQHLVEILLMVLFWISPIVYAWHFVGAQLNGVLGEIYLADPMTLAVLGMQRALWVAGTDQPIPAHLTIRMLVALGVGLVLLWVAQRIFARLQGNFAQEL